jgi:hypothetical protein
MGKPFFFAVALLSPLIALAQGSRVPRQFQGVWAADLKSCPNPEDDLLRISADKIDFYERTGKVVTVRVRDKWTVELDLDMTGEGDSWRETLKLTLSEDRRTLKDINSSENPTHHYSLVRCG